MNKRYIALFFGCMVAVSTTHSFAQAAALMPYGAVVSKDVDASSDDSAPYLITADEINQQVAQIKSEMSNHSTVRAAIFTAVGTACVGGAAAAWYFKKPTDIKRIATLEKRVKSVEGYVAGLKPASTLSSGWFSWFNKTQQPGLLTKLWRGTKALGGNTAAQAYSAFPMVAGFSLATGTLAEIVRLTSVQQALRSVVQRVAGVVMPYKAASVADQSDLTDKLIHLTEMAAQIQNPKIAALYPDHVQACRQALAKLLAYIQMAVDQAPLSRLQFRYESIKANAAFAQILATAEKLRNMPPFMAAPAEQYIQQQIGMLRHSIQYLTLNGL